MRDMLKVQELMDICLDQRDEELCQLFSQTQADGAQLAALSMQVQELISSVEVRAKMVGRDLEEINGWFDCHCQEIGLVAFMFLFELLFSYISLQFPSMFLLLTYSQSFFSLSADYLRHSR